MFSVASEAFWNFSAQIGARAVTTAALELCSAICLAVLPSVHPPQLKPMTTVARKPAPAPCRSRLSDSPSSIEGICMLGSFHLCISQLGHRPSMGYSEQIKSKAGLIGLALLQNMSSIAIGICAELTTSRLRPDAR